MLRALLLIASLAFTGAATAQYKWVDKDGRVQYGDTPPAGVKYQPLRPPAPGSPPEAADKKGDGKKAPLTSAEKDAQFRKRQQEGEQERQKQAKAQQEAEEKRENCARAKEYLRSLESGQRISSTDAKGERYFMEDAQRSQETAKARQSAQQWCN